MGCRQRQTGMAEARHGSRDAGTPTHAFSPIVDGGRVIFHVGGHDKGALTAFDLATGDVRWSWSGDGPGYASPIVAELGGTRQVVTPTQTKIVGVDAATGALLWERPLVHQFVSNSITPLVSGQTVIVAGTGPLMAFAVAKRGTQWTTEPLWENADLPLRFSTPVASGNTLIGLSGRNSGQYFAIDASTGKTLWTSDGRQAPHASLARAGDLLFSLESDGELVIVRSSQTAFEPVRRYTVATSETWAQPAISGQPHLREGRHHACPVELGLVTFAIISARLWNGSAITSEPCDRGAAAWSSYGHLS